MTDSPFDNLHKPITLDDLLTKLTISADFEGWNYGGNVNRLTISLHYEDIELASESVTIDPSGYKREESDY